MNLQLAHVRAHHDRHHAAPITRRGDAAVEPIPRVNDSNLNPSTTAALVALAARLFLGLGWLRAGVEKLINPAWWNGEALRSFLDNQRAEQLPFMEPLSRNVFDPNAVAIGIVVLVTQLAIGLLFVSGRRLHTAVAVGMLLNVTFIAMGAVSPSAFYLVLELVVLVSIGAASLHSSLGSSRKVVVTLMAASVALLPFVTTLEPGKVIEDPALMLITFFLLTALMQTLRSGEQSRFASWTQHVLLDVPDYGAHIASAPSEHSDR